MLSLLLEGGLEVYTAQSNNGGDDGIDPGPMALAADAAKAWVPYKSGMMTPIVVGTDTVKFRIAPYNVYEVHKKDFPLVFTVEGLNEETHTSTIKLNITEVLSWPSTQRSCILRTWLLTIRALVPSI